jgi:hypothetical protein
MEKPAAEAKSPAAEKEQPATDKKITPVPAKSTESGTDTAITKPKKITEEPTQDPSDK